MRRASKHTQEGRSKSSKYRIGHDQGALRAFSFRRHNFRGQCYNYRRYYGARRAEMEMDYEGRPQSKAEGTNRTWALQVARRQLARLVALPTPGVCLSLPLFCDAINSNSAVQPGQNPNTSYQLYFHTLVSQPIVSLCFPCKWAQETSQQTIFASPSRQDQIA